MIEFALAEDFNPDTVKPGEPVWFEALPARVYHTPMYGEVPITPEKLQRMVKNFHSNIRGQEIAVNFDHGMDRAKGNQAAGWFKDLKVAPSSSDPTQMSLYAAVNFTSDAAKEIKDGKWKYFSMEWDDLWQDNSGTPYQDVVAGGGITNRPIAKNMATLPVNFSEAQWDELDDETQKRFAVLSSAERDALPDSAFLYVENETGEPGEGKGEKESKSEDRHLPYKKADGSIDMPHLRAAISRLSQKATGTGDNAWLTEPLRAKLLAKARSILMAHSKNMSEAVIEAIESGDLITSESREWEHSEPGTGPTPQIGDPEQPDPGTGQPVPRRTGNPAQDDPAIGGGWRRDPLPMDPSDPRAPKGEVDTNRDTGGSALTEEELVELRKKMGLKEDASVAEMLATAETMFSEAAETRQLREEVASSSEQKRFAEQYPGVHKQMMETQAENRTAKARAFSESAARVTRTEGEKQVATKTGLSALALEKVEETHKKFSEGTGTVADFEEAVRTIVNGGIVEFGEEGSAVARDLVELDTSTPGGIQASRKAFSDKVAEVQAANAELTFSEAVRKTAVDNPDLYAAYSTPLPA